MKKNFNLLGLIEEIKDSLKAKLELIFNSTGTNIRVWPLDNQVATKSNLITVYKDQVSEDPHPQENMETFYPNQHIFVCQENLSQYSTTVDNLKIYQASKCHCCDSGHLETAERLLLHTDIVIPNWDHFNGIFRIKSQDILFKIYCNFGAVLPRRNPQRPHLHPNPNTICMRGFEREKYTQV